MPDFNLEDVLKKSQKQNVDMMGLNRSLIKIIDKRLTGLDGRVIALEGTVKNIAEKDKGKFDYGIYFRDRVLPQIITLITLSVLYLTFGKP